MHDAALSSVRLLRLRASVLTREETACCRKFLYKPVEKSTVDVMFFGQSPFQTLSIPDSSEFVFVSDMFVDDYVGGAELTTQALIDSCPGKYFKLKSSQLTAELIEQGRNKTWVFGNFSQLQPHLLPVIRGSLRYFVLEYDYKLCVYRSPSRHELERGSCDCTNSDHGRAIAGFLEGARAIFWMSEKQRDVYLKSFPVLSKKSMVLSSVFSDETLRQMRILRETTRRLASMGMHDRDRAKWIVLGSNSWVKGYQAAEAYCKNNGLDYEVVWGLPYSELLQKLSTAKGLVYLPAGADTCPRLVIEAKLLKCELVLNDNVQHKDEDWFVTMNVEHIERYLKGSTERFWNHVENETKRVPKISGYCTTYNCIKQEYPFVQCIQSMLQFCDEVCVVDGGSTDGTWEMLQNWDAASGRVYVKQVELDWSDPGFAVFDGVQKAEARRMCTGDFCWQSDVDEVVHEVDAEKIKELVRTWNVPVDVLSLPVIEYWGGPDKVRVDINPWKWRVSRNKPNITHGIPKQARAYDSEGRLYALFGDGCDMIDATTFEPLQHANFYADNVHQARLAALQGNMQALSAYEQWFNEVLKVLPAVHHYSWFDIVRKMKLYRNYWQAHWNMLANQDASDTADKNMFFDLPWSKVTDDMIEARAKQLAEETGGHIFHTKWKGQKTPSMKVQRTQPRLMLGENK